MYTNSGGISINKIGTPIGRRYMTLCTYVHSFYVLWSIRYFFDKLVCFLKIKGVKMKYSILMYFFLFSMMTQEVNQLFTGSDNELQIYKFTYCCYKKKIAP